MSQRRPLREWKKCRRMNPELEKLRTLWTEIFSDEDRKKWWKKLQSKTEQSVNRKELLDRYHIKLESDDQLTRFREWVPRQKAELAERDRMQADEEQISREFPNWTLDQVRDEVLKRAYCRILVSGDFDLGLRTVRVHTGVSNFQLNEKKFHFEAAEVIQKIYPQVRVIQKNDRLTDREKINQIRRKLFGVLPEDADP